MQRPLSKKISVALLITLTLSLFLNPLRAEAHVADVTTLDLYVQNDLEGQSIPSNQLKGRIGLSWAQANIVIERLTGEPAPETTQLTKYGREYMSYLNENLNVSNNTKACALELAGVPDRSEDDILLGSGLLVDVNILCEENLRKLVLKNTLFINDFERQANYITLYRNPDTIIKGGLLTKTSTDFEVDLSNLDEASNTTPTSTPDAGWLSGLTNSLSTYGKDSLWIAIGLVFLLGLLHTLEAGHSKSILASALISNRMSLKHGIGYAAIFTLTHIADIILLGVALLIANSFVDVFSRLSFLQTFSTYALLFISVYLFFQHFSHWFRHLIEHRFNLKLGNHSHDHHDHHHHDNHDHSHPEFEASSFRQQLLLGFLTGLSPCLFGWSIFMVILSTRQVWALFPIILAFGLGIFIALSLVALLVTRFKTPVYEKYSWIGDVSPMLSALLLVIFSLSLIL